MKTAILEAKQATTDHLTLRGGATPLATWNITALDAHSEDAFEFSDCVLALQETGCSEKQQRRHSKLAAQI